tara:strand:- start:97 stop:708 length:612 start_codon:yes stop_codon:yes gene_type:complete
MPPKSRSSKKVASKGKQETESEMSQIKIITVTSGNIDKANSLLTKGEAMVEYYHPNCGHCQTLKPEWEKMCFEMKKKYKGKATIAAVDCSDQEMLNRLQIEKNFQGFPTIFHMRNGREVREYRGERTKDALLRFAENSLPISIQLPKLKPALPFVLSPIHRRSMFRKKKSTKTRGTKKRRSLKKAVQKKAKTIKKRRAKRLRR